MARLKQISFAESAVADLENLRAWYAQQGATEAGENLLRAVMAKVERLARYPQSGRVVPEFGLETLRELIHPPLRIVYRLEIGKVRVVRVWLSERLMQQPLD